MSIREESRFGWLTGVVSEHRARLMNLLQRITGLGNPDSLPPPVFRKFIELMDQIACARDTELCFLRRIEEVEQQHDFCRIHHRLEHADPAYALRDKNPKTKERKGLWQFFHVWTNPETEEISHQEQRHNLD